MVLKDMSPLHGANVLPLLQSASVGRRGYSPMIVQATDHAACATPADEIWAKKPVSVLENGSSTT